MADESEIKAAVTRWIEAGEDLAHIQKRLREELGCSMTYMEVRFLVDDLNLDLRDQEPAKPAPSPSADLDGATDDPGGDAGEIVDGEAELVDDGGGVQIEVDAVTRPGTAVSGSVTFSDGQRMGWQIDSYGQLGLIPGNDPEYRPPQEDILEFQRKLQEELAKQGF